MKAKIILLGLCALGLAACSVDETKQVNDANSITFKATVPYATRAAATTANSLGSFSVWAWTGDDTEKTTFMNHVTAVNNGSGTYTTSPLYFWPTTSVDFLGLSPAADGYDSTGNVAYLGGEITGDIETGDAYYTGHVAAVTAGATTVKDGDGNEFESYGTVMVDVPSSYENQIDLCYAVATEKSSGSVAMNFRHALSQVVFAARTTSDEWGVEINGVSVCSVYKTGQYALPKVSTATNLDSDELGTSSISDSQGLWTVGTAYSKASFHAGVADTTVPTDGASATLTTDDGALFLIPQEVAAWDVLTDNHLNGFGSYFRINCKVTENGATLWPNSSEEADDDGFAEIAVPFDAAWEEGYKYTYTFVFGDGLGYYPPDDPNHKDELDGTPVLVPISFTVSVDEFQATEETYKDVSTQTESITVNSLTDLKAAIEAGYGEITITADGEDEGAITLEGEYLNFTSDCTLTLGDGVVITATNSTGNEYPSINGYNGYTAAICVTSGTLTINGEGSVVTTGDSNAKGTEGIWVNGGTVIINGGTYKGGSWDTTDEGSESAVFVEYGAAYIYDGTFYSGKWKESGDLYYVLNCMDTPRKNGQAWIYVYGGSYYKFDPSNCNSEGAGTNFVVDGYNVVANSPETDWYTVVEVN